MKGLIMKENKERDLKLERFLNYYSRVLHVENNESRKEEVKLALGLAVKDLPAGFINYFDSIILIKVGQLYASCYKRYLTELSNFMKREVSIGKKEDDDPVMELKASFLRAISPLVEEHYRFFHQERLAAIKKIIVIGNDRMIKQSKCFMPVIGLFFNWVFPQFALYFKACLEKKIQRRNQLIQDLSIFCSKEKSVGHDAVAFKVRNRLTEKDLLAVFTKREGRAMTAIASSLPELS
jgi:hypothetical protein